MYYSVSKELSGLGSKMTELGRQLDGKVNQRIQTLGDLVVAYTDMMDRHDKGLLKEHKVILITECKLLTSCSGCD